MIWADRLALVWLTIFVVFLLFMTQVMHGGFILWLPALAIFVGVPWLMLRVIHLTLSRS